MSADGGFGPWWRERSGPDLRPPPASGAGSRRAFGHTWWGRAWLEALEGRAALDPNRLSRGRGYARRGAVTELAVERGAVTAAVQGTRASPYKVAVGVTQFSSDDWDAVLGVVAAQLGRTAALLDGELPPELVDDVGAVGLSLLPGAGELQPRCSCPDWAVPCKHSAAVCYLVADVLDDDPFALLTLRGMGRDEVLAELRLLRAGGVTAMADEQVGSVRRPVDDGLRARDAYARELAPLPSIPLPPPRPGQPAVAALAPPPESGVSRDALVALATDAARRAWELAAGDGDGGMALTMEQDVARRAVALLGRNDLGERSELGEPAELAELAGRVGLSNRELAHRARAWDIGGAGGLGALVTSWKPEPAELAVGKVALAATLGGRVNARGNRLTRDRTQLRLGQDGLWYLFDRSSDGWELAAAGSPDPADLVGRASPASDS